MSYRSLSLTFALLVSLASTASAQQGTVAPMPSPEQPAEEQEVERYGHHILLADALTLGAMAASAKMESAPLFTASFIAGTFAPGVVHLLHDNGRAAVLSTLVVRPIAVYGGAWLGASMAASDCDASYTDDEGTYDCGFEAIGGAVAGAVVGYGVALAVDTFVLAKRTRPRAPARAARTWTPQVAPSPQGLQVGLGGTF